MKFFFVRLHTCACNSHIEVACNPMWRKLAWDILPCEDYLNDHLWFSSWCKTSLTFHVFNAILEFLIAYDSWLMINEPAQTKATLHSMCNMMASDRYVQMSDVPLCSFEYFLKKANAPHCTNYKWSIVFCMCQSSILMYDLPFSKFHRQTLPSNCECGSVNSTCTCSASTRIL